MVGPSSQGPPPDWAVAPEGATGSTPERSQAAAADPWQGDVSDGVAAWLHSVAAGDVSDVSESRVGSGLAPDDDGSGAEADQEAVARKILLDALTGQARSRKELADKLAKKNVPEALAQRLLDRFEEVGLVDDEAFARSWIASRQPGKGLARRALAQELRRKGVDDTVAREALDEIDPDDEEQAARRLVHKKMRSLGSVDRTKATRRLVGMLARKGYPPGLSYTIVREALDDERGGDEDGAFQPPHGW